VNPTICFTWINEHWSLVDTTEANQVIKDLLSCITYPTIFHIMMDYLPIQALSVLCECIFSSSSETMTKCWNCIGLILMEVLQMLKFFLKNECLDLSKGWAVSQMDMLVDEDED
ncbi:hypothetical protein BKA83DRAFT_75644, partial [Pisolithus microcarpus]